MHSKCRKYYLEVKERIHIIGIKVNKGNFTATLIRFNQNLNYEKIYVFRIANILPFLVTAKCFLYIFFDFNIILLFGGKNDLFRTSRGLRWCENDLFHTVRGFRRGENDLFYAFRGLRWCENALFHAFRGFRRCENDLFHTIRGLCWLNRPIFREEKGKVIAGSRPSHRLPYLPAGR